MGLECQEIDCKGISFVVTLYPVRMIGMDEGSNIKSFVQMSILMTDGKSQTRGLGLSLLLTTMKR